VAVASRAISEPSVDVRGSSVADQREPRQGPVDPQRSTAEQQAVELELRHGRDHAEARVRGRGRGRGAVRGETRSLAIGGAHGQARDGGRLQHDRIGRRVGGAVDDLDHVAVTGRGDGEGQARVHGRAGERRRERAVGIAELLLVRALE
jgi:hypothetical protein